LESIFEPPVAGGDGIAGRVHHHESRPPVAQRRQPLDVIGMPVRNQHAGERRAAQRGGERRQVLRMPDAGVDERRLAARQQPGVVAGRPRPLGRVPGGDQNRRLSQKNLEPKVDEIAVGEAADRVGSGSREPAERSLERDIVAKSGAGDAPHKT
jgi:hypothetical protein